MTAASVRRCAAASRCELRAARICSVALVGLASCTESFAPFSDHQLAVGAQVAARVRPGALEATVRAIYAAHTSDPGRVDRGDRCGTSAHCIHSSTAAGALIVSALQAADLPGARLDEQLRTEDGLTTRNLWLDLPGRTLPSEWVIAMAHYDAWFGGADDDTTGVAVLLEAAVALAGVELDRSVRLLFTDAEELGQVGAGRYLDEYGTTGVVLVLGAEMLGHRVNEGGWLEQLDTAEFTAQANEDAAGAAYQMAHLARWLPEPTAIEPVVYPGNGVSGLNFALQIDSPDTAQFWFDGASAVHFETLGANPGYYHTPEDTPDVLDYDHLARAGRAWAGSLAAFATQAQ